MKNALLVLALLAFATAASANPKTLSFDRVAVVATAQGATFNSSGPSFLPALGIGYSLTSNLTLIADYGQDFAQEIGVGRVGARAKIAHFGSDGVVYLGGGWVHYDNVPGAEKRESWEASVHGAWPLARDRLGRIRASLIASVTHDPGEQLTTCRLGARLHLLGGKPSQAVEIGPSLP